MAEEIKTPEQQLMEKGAELLEAGLQKLENWLGKKFTVKQSKMIIALVLGTTATVITIFSIKDDEGSAESAELKAKKEAAAKAIASSQA